MKSDSIFARKRGATPHQTRHFPPRYDDFNRLLTSNQNNGQSVFSYDYDRYGNRWHQNGPFPNPPQPLNFTHNNNRIDGFSYDAAGNLLSDGVHSYFYDAESRIIQVDGNNLGTCSLPTTACYVYNASGERVRKTIGITNGTTSVDYLYDLASHEIIELSSTGVMNRGEVYAGSRHVATYELGTTYLNFSDWLGTERLRTLATGVTCESITSLPFGDNQITSGSCADSSPMHFTGKQRDIESGLDDFDARYYSSAFGRFVSADWSGTPEPVPYADLIDPQSLNLYAYVRNNPLSHADSDGHGFWEKFKNLFSEAGCWCSDSEAASVDRIYIHNHFPKGVLINGKIVQPKDIPDNLIRPIAAQAQLQVATEEYNERFHQNNFSLNFPGGQLQSKWDHASDFGVGGNYNPENEAAFRNAIESHMTDANTIEIDGTYRGQAGYKFFVNPNTGLTVITNGTGEFVSGWKLSAAQLKYLLTSGRLN